MYAKIAKTNVGFWLRIIDRGKGHMNANFVTVFPYINDILIFINSKYIQGIQVEVTTNVKTNLV